eukprot:372739-Rhodomonas_salina.3
MDRRPTARILRQLGLLSHRHQELRRLTYFVLHSADSPQKQQHTQPSHSHTKVPIKCPSGPEPSTVHPNPHPFAHHQSSIIHLKQSCPLARPSWFRKEAGELAEIASEGGREESEVEGVGSKVSKQGSRV